MAEMFHRDDGAFVIYYITTAPVNFDSALLKGCCEQFKTQKCEQLARQLHNSWCLMPAIVLNSPDVWAIRSLCCSDYLTIGQL